MNHYLASAFCLLSFIFLITELSINATGAGINPKVLRLRYPNGGAIKADNLDLSGQCSILEWPNRVIPYMIALENVPGYPNDLSKSNEFVKLIEECVSYFDGLKESLQGISWVKLDKERLKKNAVKDYVEFRYHESVSSSMVGKVGGVQVIHISSWALDAYIENDGERSIVIREMLNTMGRCYLEETDEKRLTGEKYEIVQGKKRTEKYLSHIIAQSEGDDYEGFYSDRISADDREELRKIYSHYGTTCTLEFDTSPMKQCWFECLTCIGGDSEKGYCLPCIRKGDHKSHHLVYHNDSSEFRCDSSATNYPKACFALIDPMERPFQPSYFCQSCSFSSPLCRFCYETFHEGHVKSGFTGRSERFLCQVMKGVELNVLSTSDETFDIPEVVDLTLYDDNTFSIIRYCTGKTVEIVNKPLLGNLPNLPLPEKDEKIVGVKAAFISGPPSHVGQPKEATLNMYLSTENEIYWSNEMPFIWRRVKTDPDVSFAKCSVGSDKYAYALDTTGRLLKWNRDDKTFYYYFDGDESEKRFKDLSVGYDGFVLLVERQTGFLFTTADGNGYKRVKSPSDSDPDLIFVISRNQILSFKNGLGFGLLKTGLSEVELELVGGYFITSEHYSRIRLSSSGDLIIGINGEGKVHVFRLSDPSALIDRVPKCIPSRVIPSSYPSAGVHQIKITVRNELKTAHKFLINSLLTTSEDSERDDGDYGWITILPESEYTWKYLSNGWNLIISEDREFTHLNVQEGELKLSYLQGEKKNYFCMPQQKFGISKEELASVQRVFYKLGDAADSPNDERNDQPIVTLQNVLNDLKMQPRAELGIQTHITYWKVYNRSDSSVKVWLTRRESKGSRAGAVAAGVSIDPNMSDHWERDPESYEALTLCDPERNLCQVFYNHPLTVEWYGFYEHLLFSLT